jgi:hypothetical protein
VGPMNKRYIATFSEVTNTEQVRLVVVDQRQSKVVHDSVSAKELQGSLKKFFLIHYGTEIMFVENSQPAPPKPDHAEGQ